MASTDKTVPKQLTPFKPGQSGNPAGRPKGARNKLGEKFLEDLLDDWKVHGPAALAETRETKPEAYVKVVASILPKELNLKVNEFDGLTDDELARELASISKQLVSHGYNIGERTAAPQQNRAGEGKSPKVH